MGSLNTNLLLGTARDSADLEARSINSADSETDSFPHDEVENSSVFATGTARINALFPRSFKRNARAVVRWTAGPDPPRVWRIHPFFAEQQEAPLKLIDRFCPKNIHKFWLLLFFYSIWLLVFVSVLRSSAFSDEIPGYGSPLQLSCASSFWGDLNYCGFNGESCRPFGNTSVPFRCPASCSTAQVWNPHAVGTQEIVYQPLVIGGPTNKSMSSAFYRGDSFICSAAIHAGYINDADGGCGVASLIGEQSNFPKVKQNGIASIAFDSNFPLSFSFVESVRSNCKDLRWPLLGVSVFFTALLSIFTASPAVFFFSIWTGIFFHVALVSDQPTFSTYYDLIAIAVSKFLPGTFCMFVMYRYVVSYTLGGFRGQFEKTILWLGGCWVGSLNNYTFDKIPIQRLTTHDIKAQPGAITALIIICVSLFCIALGQAWVIRIEGKMRPYLALYVGMGSTLILLIAVPHMNLRIHHYILALLLLPGTFPQTRLGLLYQGILVGLFINGIGRWGFDSLLQTAEDIIGDGQVGSAIPEILEPVINGLQNITFTWRDIARDFNGISILVNEVERFVAYSDGGPNSEMRFTWNRQAPEGSPEYFRFGFLDGNAPGDYTKAGVWEADGSWTKMKPGPSV